MRIFQITETDKWIPTEKGFFQAENHAQAMSLVDNDTHRITNAMFRETEYSGHYYSVAEITNAKRMIVFIFEKNV